MDARYAHPAVTKLWSLEWTYSTWLRIETLVLQAQLKNDAISPDAAPLLPRLTDQVPEVDVQAILKIEERTRHDVAAFLEWVRSWSGPRAAFLHYGLTSSDLVETAQGVRFREMRNGLVDRLATLQSELTRWSLDDTPILSRTHGQIAEAMTMRARAWGWTTNVAQAGTALLRATRNMQVAKISGPAGIYSNVPPVIEATVADQLHIYPHGPGATQIASRQPLAAWASAASQLVDALAKVAHDLRLMYLLGEVQMYNSEGQVGSSSMAHKVNPIAAEQIAGMAALARGYSMSLQQLPLWLERDISNSSVERVAVPDLWHVTFHAIDLAIRMLARAEMNHAGAIRSFKQAGRAPMVFEETMANIARGMSWDEARAAANTTLVCADGGQGRWAMSNYPVPHPSEMR